MGRRLIKEERKKERRREAGEERYLKDRQQPRVAPHRYGLSMLRGSSMASGEAEDEIPWFSAGGVGHDRKRRGDSMAS
jgi:hypothetical protein